jgi:hypothetical protein
VRTKLLLNLGAPIDKQHPPSHPRFRVCFLLILFYFILFLLLLLPGVGQPKRDSSEARSRPIRWGKQIQVHVGAGMHSSSQFSLPIKIRLFMLNYAEHRRHSQFACEAMIL